MNTIPPSRLWPRVLKKKSQRWRTPITKRGGRPEGRAEDHWLRAEREIRTKIDEKPASETESGHRVEEAIHAGQ